MEDLEEERRLQEEEERKKKNLKKAKTKKWHPLLSDTS